VVGPHEYRWLLDAYAWLLIAVLLLPILACVPMAFTRFTFLSFPPPGYSTRWFVEYFGSPLWMGATARSFCIGLASAVLTLLIAASAAYGLARSPSRLVGTVFLLFLLPLVKGGLIAAFIFAFLNSFEELTVALFIGGGLRVTLPRQMWDDINLQVTPTLAAASLFVLAVVTVLFLLAERLRAKRLGPARSR
jgi:ABC-type spermidine/putrescine transport system permease subunit II